MKINNRMLHYLNKALDERLEWVYPPPSEADRKKRQRAAHLRLKKFWPSDWQRALELACADLEAHTITPSAEDMDTLKAVKRDLDEWNMDEAYRREEERDK